MMFWCLAAFYLCVFENGVEGGSEFNCGRGLWVRA